MHVLGVSWHVRACPCVSVRPLGFACPPLPRHARPHRRCARPAPSPRLPGRSASLRVPEWRRPPRDPDKAKVKVKARSRSDLALCPRSPEPGGPGGGGGSSGGGVGGGTEAPPSSLPPQAEEPESRPEPEPEPEPELEPPAWRELVPPQALRALSKSEIKRQEVINGEGGPPGPPPHPDTPWKHPLNHRDTPETTPETPRIPLGPLPHPDTPWDHRDTLRTPPRTPGTPGRPHPTLTPPGPPP